MKLLFTIAALLHFAAMPIYAQTGRENPTADWALINGQIHTMDEAGTVAEAIGIEGNEIVYVGDASGLANVIGIGTEVIDLDGQMVLPGFVDGHIHAAAGGLIMLGVDLQSDDPEEILARVRQEVETNDSDLILGYGVRFNPWTDGNPTAAMLDEIESERPIYLWAIDGHAAWVNSKALEIAGIDKDTPDTVPGYAFFERDEEGNPTGWIVEVPAQMQVLSALLDITPEFLAEGVKDWMQKFAAAGLTAAHDHGIQGLGQAEGFQMLQAFEQAGDLPVRMVGSWYWNDPTVDPVPGTLEFKETYNSGLVKVNYLKINLDGGDDKWSALMLEPYEDKPDLVVEPIIPFDILEETLIRADAAGIDVTCHCFGDLAVRKLLDAVEAAIEANPPRERFHKISHGLWVHPDDRPRFAELGVTYDSTSIWMSLDPTLDTITRFRVGEDRLNQVIPAREVIDAGGNFSLGADWPVSGYLSEYRPLSQIEAAVLRQLDGRKDVPPLGNPLTLDQAIRAMTINVANGMGMGDEIGSLEVGKKADLVVLAENLFEIDLNDISEVEVRYTIMNGELTYDHSAE